MVFFLNGLAVELILRDCEFVLYNDCGICCALLYTLSFSSIPRLSPDWGIYLDSIGEAPLKVKMSLSLLFACVSLTRIEHMFCVCNVD